MKERHDINDLDSDLEITNKNFSINNLVTDVFVFVAAISAVITTMIGLYILCKHNKFRTLVVSLAL